MAEAALELFSERGFDHTSVDDIVGAARTSKSAFYEHWSSREDCLRWLLDRLGERIVLEVAEHAAVVEDPVERLRRGLAGFVQACARDHRLARLLLVESVGVGGPVEDSRRDIQDRFVRLAAAQLRDAARAGDGYAIDPVVFGRAVVGATQEAAAMLIAQPALDPKDVIDGLSAVFARPALAP